MKCWCEEAEFDDTVVLIRTYLIDGSVVVHGRDYCATGGPAFWSSKDEAAGYHPNTGEPIDTPEIPEFWKGQRRG